MGIVTHKHAEFFRHIADGGLISDWEMRPNSEHGWISLTNDGGWLRTIFRDADRVSLRRKPKTSRERFEDWWVHIDWTYMTPRELAEAAWQEAEKQAMES